MQSLTRWLREARESRGLTMRELGALLGVTHSYVQKIELGERRLDVVEFVWYCEALDVAPYDGLAVIIQCRQRTHKRRTSRP
ncbi:helix-turn-helix domain-containing protein [uncultured Pseudomonas sp.]|uniref:helix-turn-helix domain-containing protein n=1 Tax=Pseudomonas citronellolis TaxID=53408 RepID=UPI0035A71D09